MGDFKKCSTSLKQLIFLCRYDNHREQILRGHTDYEDQSLDIFPYFTAACFKGFDDDSSGFYAVYAKVFDQLAAEDIEFMDSTEEYESIPKFGTSNSDYETVVGPFYAYWQSYCTKKTYTWLCPHNISEIRDRRILREIEKETKKIAQKKRKERNEEVRALVAFVRKRDKRVQEYRKFLEAKAEQNRAKQQQHRLAQLRRNQQEAQEMQKNPTSIFNVDHEEQLRLLEQAYGSDSEYDSDDYDEDELGSENEESVAAEETYIDELYCVACNKAFKNVSSFENHESSKKHRENTERLREHMQSEDAEYAEENLETPENKSGSESELAHIDSDAPSDTVELKKNSNKKSKKSKKLQKQKQYQSDGENDDADINNMSLDGIDIGNISKAADEDNWSDDNGKKKKKTKNKKTTKKPAETEHQPNVEAADETPKQPTIGNKKIQKNATKNAAKNAAKNESTADVNHTCVTCNSSFDSKNKLFTHLKKTNHGVYLPKGQQNRTK